jgi:hypothetical protein
MGSSETFVVRVYRRSRANGAPLVGVVESIASGRTDRFTSFEQLRAILEGRCPRSERGGKGIRRQEP